MVNTRSGKTGLPTHAKKNLIRKREPLSARLRRLYYNPKSPVGFSSVKKLENTVPQNERKNVVKWLQAQDIYTMFRPRRRNFPVNFNLATRPDHCWELDLAILDKHADENDGFKYLFFVVDMFDRFLWVEPMKSKSGEATLKAFKSILARAKGRKPLYVRSDAGGEFSNDELKKYLKSIGVTWQLAGNWAKAGICERVIRTIKDKLYKIFTFRGSFKYVDILDDVVYAYNHSKHSRLGFAPAEIKENDIFTIWKRHYKSRVDGAPPTPRFGVGDYVRVLIKRKGALQDRGYKQGWSNEIFKIFRVQVKHQTGYLAEPLFHIKDLRGEPVLGGWVASELTPVVFDPKKDSFRINEILDTRINKTTRRKEYKVSFWGYPKEFNEWVEARSVKKLGK